MLLSNVIAVNYDDDDSVMVSQHEQYHNPETEVATWNSAINNFMTYVLF